MITGLYAALLALIQIKLTFGVVKLRRGKKVSIGDGGDDELARRIRVHGNFIETVPITLILMMIAELSGSPFWCLHVLGVAIVGARISHAIGISSGTGHGKFRFYGMLMTINVIIAAALLCLWFAWPLLLPVS